MNDSTDTMNTCDINISVIGPPAVGKSAVTVRYLTRRFIGEYSSSKDQLYVKCTVIDGHSVKQRIIDSSSERTGGLSLCEILQWSHGIVVVFSLTDLSSFYAAAALLQKLDCADEWPLCILVGNKSDLSHIRCFDYQWGLSTCALRGCPYLEVSAAGGCKGIDLAFTSISRLVLRSRRKESGFNLRSILHNWWKKLRRKESQN